MVTPEAANAARSQHDHSQLAPDPNIRESCVNVTQIRGAANRPFRRSCAETSGLPARRVSGREGRTRRVDETLLKYKSPIMPGVASESCGISWIFASREAQLCDFHFGRERRSYRPRRLICAPLFELIASAGGRERVSALFSGIYTCTRNNRRGLPGY